MFIMRKNFIVIIIIILIIIIYLFNNKEYFLLSDYTEKIMNKSNSNSCSLKKFIRGPYISKCTNIKLNNNMLYALCPNRELDNQYFSRKLNLNDCKNNCTNININDRGELFCQ